MLIIAATLPLGVGLSAGVFSFADGYLFRRLPFPAADQLYFLRDPNARIALQGSDAAVLRSKHSGSWPSSSPAWAFSASSPISSSTALVT